MANIQYPLINGIRYDFSCIEVDLGIPGLPRFHGFKAINYSRKRSRTKVRGNHPDPLGKTRGTNDYTADTELYLAEWNAFMQAMGDGYGDVFFNVIVTYTDDQNNIITDVLEGCTIDSTEASQSQSADPLMRKVTLDPLKVRYGKRDDVTKSL